MIHIDVIFSQTNIPVGNWRVHLPFNTLKQLAIAGNTIYCTSGISTFSYNNGEVNILSKINGLSDVDISQIEYSPLHSTLIIGYRSGVIQLMSNTDSYTSNAIQRSNIVGSKAINHILTEGDVAYLSGDYGVVVFDLKRREVKESYLNLSSGGATNKVFASAINKNKDSIFLATEKGLLTARLSGSVNLMDFNNWYTYSTNDSLSTSDLACISYLGNTMICGVNGKGLYYKLGNKWKKMPVPVSVTSKINSLYNTNDKLLACIDSFVYEINSITQFTVKLSRPEITTPSSAKYDDYGNIWVADGWHGLVKKSADGNIQSIYPNGPLSRRAFNLHYFNNNILVAPGGYNISYGRQFNRDGYFVFENNQIWRHYETRVGNRIIGDITYATFNAANGELYLSSHGDGLLKVTADKQLYVFDFTNSPLSKAAAQASTYIGGTAVDDAGNLWITNWNTATGVPSLHVYGKDGEWKNSYVLSSNQNSEARSLLDVVIDSYGNKWLLAQNTGLSGGMIIFNEKENRERRLGTELGNGNLPSYQVRCIAKDLDGAIWIGTNKGVAVCRNPNEIFDPSTDLTKPLYDGFPLLFESEVYCIETDGANRKWMGTNDGLWLFNSDASEAIHHFTTENSPLLSNSILDVKVHPLTGEVFIATDLGIVSYRGDATSAPKQLTQAEVFPNPVKPGFSGLVAIHKLAHNANVKITDMYGNLVYETNANGGMATWNLKNYNGERAKPGVYLIFTSNEEGGSFLGSKLVILD
ncbi:MAG: T9SS type A sorting domain-containing protein [Cytophagaceae bacterium]|nr:T9SS type A sorting domain-containing protein [Cytophagaceae bacterium]MDW8456300.1 T9SS type A sorting domain-containing protein [Cytophagaceae bacterium]